MHDDAVLLLPLNIEGGRERSTLTKLNKAWMYGFSHITDEVR